MGVGVLMEARKEGREGQKVRDMGLCDSGCGLGIGAFESSCPDLKAGVASNRTPLSRQVG